MKKAISEKLTDIILDLDDTLLVFKCALRDEGCENTAEFRAAEILSAVLANFAIDNGLEGYSVDYVNRMQYKLSMTSVLNELSQVYQIEVDEA